jgi:hypothetical protein
MVDQLLPIASRADLGLPASWSQIMFWLTATATFSLPMQFPSQKERNFPEIPILEKIWR